MFSLRVFLIVLATLCSILTSVSSQTDPIILKGILESMDNNKDTVSLSDSTVLIRRLVYDHDVIIVPDTLFCVVDSLGTAVFWASRKNAFFDIKVFSRSTKPLYLMPEFKRALQYIDRDSSYVISGFTKNSKDVYTSYEKPIFIASSDFIKEVMSLLGGTWSPVIMRKVDCHSPEIIKKISLEIVQRLNFNPFYTHYLEPHLFIDVSVLIKRYLEIQTRQ